MWSPVKAISAGAIVIGVTVGTWPRVMSGTRQDGNRRPGSCRGGVHPLTIRPS